jgi:hypothetical protein
MLMTRVYSIALLRAVLAKLSGGGGARKHSFPAADFPKIRSDLSLEGKYARCSSMSTAGCAPEDWFWFHANDNNSKSISSGEYCDSSSTSSMEWLSSIVRVLKLRCLCMAAGGWWLVWSDCLFILERNFVSQRLKRMVLPHRFAKLFRLSDVPCDKRTASPIVSDCLMYRATKTATVWRCDGTRMRPPRSPPGPPSRSGEESARFGIMRKGPTIRAAPNLFETTRFDSIVSCSRACEHQNRAYLLHTGRLERRADGDRRGAHV